MLGWHSIPWFVAGVSLEDLQRRTRTQRVAPR